MTQIAKTPYRTIYNKYHPFIPPLKMAPQAASPTSTDRTVSSQEVLLKISICHTRRPWYIQAEYLVLSSQKLSVLRDAFYCEADFVSMDPLDVNPNTMTCKVSSSYFFIENVFYNDLRSGSAEDYSQ